MGYVSMVVLKVIESGIYFYVGYHLRRNPKTSVCLLIVLLFDSASISLGFTWILKNKFVTLSLVECRACNQFEDLALPAAANES